MFPEYKQIKSYEPHCPKCKEKLGGNNSGLLPWTCKCGTWKYNPENKKFNIIKRLK